MFLKDLVINITVATIDLWKLEWCLTNLKNSLNICWTKVWIFCVSSVAQEFEDSNLFIWSFAFFFFLTIFHKRHPRGKKHFEHNLVRLWFKRDGLRGNFHDRRRWSLRYFYDRNNDDDDDDKIITMALRTKTLSTY